ncbi:MULTISPECIES: LytTR family DNA-binding domain-containing protein [unclassified Aureispira]|uniref:LytR/AlgR family response regulator transcription factor n=1 Tax=unclassified Aureispira TaxID=2649989 RepID=UPI0006985064|nr:MULTISPECIES: LytTR family DNA-binding domain-containing protein [unclassified Aureispira]WMX16830.1 LytTR family DNA-binding domain-containing protein [Aureispira sp. CCB-E]
MDTNSSQHHFTFIKSNKKYIKINLDEITYIKGLGNYVEIYMQLGKRYIYYKALKDLIEVLPPHFMRIHNSYIVNLMAIDALEDNHIYINNDKISVAKSYRDCLKKSIEGLLL